MDLPLSNSGFLFHLFGVTNVPNESPEKYRNRTAHLRALTVIEKIYKIEVIDQNLVIKAGQPHDTLANSEQSVSS